MQHGTHEGKERGASLCNPSPFPLSLSYLPPLPQAVVTPVGAPVTSPPAWLPEGRALAPLWPRPIYLTEAPWPRNPQPSESLGPHFSLPPDTSPLPLPLLSSDFLSLHCVPFPSFPSSPQ